MSEENKAANPWQNLDVPSDKVNLTSRRVSADSPWDIFWAIDSLRSKLLLLEFSSSIDVSGKLPNLRGIDVKMLQQASPESNILLVGLLESENSDIFHQLCLDIISATEQAETEEGAVQSFLMRTWRWHKMLERGGNYGKLSYEELKGLIAELHTLESILFPLLGIDSTVRAWQGPLGAIKDFEIGSNSIEVKAKKSPTIPEIRISSAYQLDTTDIENLFLSVVEVIEQSGAGKDTFTIVEFVSKIISVIGEESPVSLDIFMQKIAIAGLDLEDDYSDYIWSIGNHALYEVSEDFPKIIPSSYERGVKSVNYIIQLDECEKFIATIEDLRNKVN